MAGSPKTESETASAEPEAEAIPVERLLAESNAFLGVPAHVAAGALHDAAKKNLTVAEAQKLVDRFQSRAVEAS